MALQLHPNAVSNFNQKAEELLPKFAIRAHPDIHDTFPSELYVDHAIGDQEIIGDISHGEVDFTGQECAKYFSIDGNLFGLAGDAYKEFHKLCEGIQRTEAFHNTVSLASLKNEVFEWLKSRHNQITTLSLLEFIIPNLESKIKDLEIWVPIFAMVIQSEFSVGNVLFQSISKARIDNWNSAIVSGRPEEEAQRITQFFEQERKEIQGLAAGTLKLTAEPNRAGQLALERVEQALNVLCFFHPANFHPRLVCHTTVLGKQNVQTTKYYVVENSVLVASTASVVDSGYHPWKIDNALLRRMQQDGLNKLSDILASHKRSEFHNTIIDTLQIYARSALATFYSDKLLYILASLESLLLKNSSEPIQQNVGERIAFALSRHPEARKAIVKNFREVYELRSDFVHHANDIRTEHIELLNRFMLNAWTFLSSVIRNADNFSNKQQMIDAIENIKFS